MPGQTPAFKRLVLGLQAGPSARAIKAAAEFASLLNLELVGLFFEDTRLEKLSGIPFVREFRLLGGGWHPIDIDRLSRDFELAARNAERLLANEAMQFSTRWQFEVTRELFSEAFGALSRASDIVMIVQPERPAEYATPQFALLMEAALQSAPAVMLLRPPVAKERASHSDCPDTQRYVYLHRSRDRHRSKRGTRDFPDTA